MVQPNTTSGWQTNGASVPADPRPTNGYAITALVSSLVLAPLGIVFGHIALKQIRRTGEAGRGLAIGGLTLGYAITCISVVSMLILVGSAGKVTDSATGSEQPIGTSRPEGNEKGMDTLSAEAINLQKEFDAKREQIALDIYSTTVADGYAGYDIFKGVTIKDASEGMDPQSILDRDAAKSHFVTSMTVADAIKNASFLAKSGTPAYGITTRLINTATQPSSDRNMLISSKYFTDGTLSDPASGSVIASAVSIPTWVIGNMSSRHRTNAVAVFQYARSQDGSTGEWLLVNSMRQGDQGWTDPLRVDQAILSRK